MTPAKVLVLAIDAASPELLERWAADGTLPNLRALMERGLVGRTRNVDGFCIGSTWPSWYTGVTPARHGLHYLVQLKPGTYHLYRPAEEGLVKREAFWSHMSRAGRRVAVLDVPVSAVDRSLNGVQTVEWGGHDAFSACSRTQRIWQRELSLHSARIRSQHRAMRFAEQRAGTETS